MKLNGRLLSIVLFALVCLGLVAFCDNREVGAHPDDREGVSSFSHAHPKTDTKWEHCHDHHYDATGILDDHAGHYAPDFERGNFCPHGYHATPTPVSSPTVMPYPTATPGGPVPLRPTATPGPRITEPQPTRPPRDGRPPRPTVQPPVLIVLPTVTPVPLISQEQQVAQPTPESTVIAEQPWAVDLAACGAPGFAWNHLGEVHTIAEGLVVGHAESCEQAGQVAQLWMQDHLGRPVNAPPPGQAFDLGEHGCPGWLWSGDGLTVHHIDDPAANGGVLGTALSVDDAIALITAYLTTGRISPSTPTPEPRNQASTPTARTGRGSGTAPTPKPQPERHRETSTPQGVCSRYPHTYVRDASRGQTYRVIQRDGCSYRRWVHPDSPLVYAIPWKTVNAIHTVPVESILSIPLDREQPWDSDNPSDFLLVRRFDGSPDVRIFVHGGGEDGRRDRPSASSIDGSGASSNNRVGQWEHVPDIATFAARGYRWDDVVAADAQFWQEVE